MKTFLAVDLGTTTIVASLLDGKTGERLASGMELNPQRIFGADVVSRITAAVSADADRHEMSRLVNDTLQSLAFRLLSEAGRDPESLEKVAVAGNPAMEHLLLHLPVDSLARVPYRPLFTEGKSLRTVETGWGIDAGLFVFPIPGGFVGGDLVAFLYGQEINHSPSTINSSRLYLDLGTNAEIALCTGGFIYATSAAAGPAFEGGNLLCGMPALPGAINSVAISDGKVTITTIGDQHPLGLCGTGALSAVVSLLDAGLLEVSGSLPMPDEIPSNLANRMIERNGEQVFLIYRDSSRELFLSQSDLRGIQLAKAAIRGGVEVLLSKTRMTGEEISDVVISGSFGFSISPGILTGLGIIPPAISGGVRTVPDGAVTGVERFLSVGGSITAINEMASGIKMLPLSGNPMFESFFLQHMDFPGRRVSY